MIAKEIFKLLLNDHSIMSYGKYGHRLRDANGSPMLRIHNKTFEHFKYMYLRQTKNKSWVIDKRKVRSLHGNHICKKIYKKIQHAKNNRAAAHE
jgi:hypothetical protein